MTREVWWSRFGDVMNAKGYFRVSTLSEQMLDEAIAWHLGLEEAGAEEWQRFVEWLEADPRHQEIYDRLTLEEAALAETQVPSPRIVTAPRRPMHRSWVRYGGWTGGALAAAAAAWLALMPVVAGDSHFLIQTKAGEQRSVTLPDGSVIALNGGTTLKLDHKDPRSVELAGGEAFFTVVHHADRPFEVKSGDVVLRDVGTRFVVTRGHGVMEVRVAEGAVQFQPDRDQLTLTKGMMLSYDDAAAHATLSQIAAESVAGWTRGELDFEGTTMGRAAEEIARTTGMPVRVAAAIADRPFTGTLHVRRAPADVIANFAELGGGQALRDGPGWLIAPRQASAR